MGTVYGMMSAMPIWGSVLLLLGASLTLGFLGLPLWVWTITTFALFWLLAVPKLLCYFVLGLMVLACVPPIRKLLLSANVMRALKALKLLPKISNTERIALEAGHTWVDAELFSGKPDFGKLMSEPYQNLSEKEQNFLDHQCERVCRMVDDHKTYEEGDLSREVWDYLKKERFFGLIIPEEFGGLGFSALGHSEVVGKLVTSSIPLAISVMVPNSLGPAELLVHYGTEAQKKYYLPRLAKGLEIPCFGLTEPEAGSDAGAMSSTGVLFRGEDGKLYVRLSWRKRYITLGAIATVLGLAVKLLDPDNLLGKGTDLGITCFLVPSKTKGVVLGRRHDPLGVPFYNSPIEGHDVVVSVDQIIGGLAGAGQGWKMLMECLAAGRSISLPGQSTGGVKKISRMIGAYAQVRQQFGMPIAKFDGVGEVLARVGAMTYLLEACRIYTVGAVDKGLKPSVISAIAKYQATEISRWVINDAMDVSGGSGISLGKRNLLARAYTAAPIGITVEGANILTRTMIIFGQGAIRCHPYAYAEIVALQNDDLDAFDKAFWGHVKHIVRNKCRAFLLSISRGHLARVPAGPMADYYRKLSWASASFAFLADMAMAAMGGSLKFREKITGRFADILSWMYLTTAVLRRFEAEGRLKEHEPFVHYAARFGLVKIQQAFEGLYDNMDVPVLGFLFKYPIAWWSRLNPLASLAEDSVGHKIAKAMTTPGEVRDALTSRGVYLPVDLNDAYGRLENAFNLAFEAQGIMRKVHNAIKAGDLPKGKGSERIQEAKDKGIISLKEVEILKLAKEACKDAIEVDSFALKDYRKGVVNCVTESPEAEAKVSNA